MSGEKSIELQMMEAALSSRRDYVARDAMEILMTRSHLNDKPSDPDWVARNAYAYADAMEAARGNKIEGGEAVVGSTGVPPVSESVPLSGVAGETPATAGQRPALPDAESRIEALQRRVGTKVDGIWGPLSTAAAKTYIQNRKPSPNPWPAQDRASMEAFYGKAGDESNLTTINVAGMGVLFEGKAVNTIRVNKKCAVSLLRIIKKLSTMEVAKPFLVRYAGVFSNRNISNSVTLSTHAYGASIDLDPLGNGEKTPWPVQSTMCIEVMEVFADEGWLCAGAEWGRDAMHFQATR